MYTNKMPTGMTLMIAISLITGHGPRSNGQRKIAHKVYTTQKNIKPKYRTKNSASASSTNSVCVLYSDVGSVRSSGTSSGFAGYRVTFAIAFTPNESSGIISIL